MNRMAQAASVALAAVLVAGGLGVADEPASQAKLLAVLPDCCNTPDGMSLQADDSIVVSVPNFNNDKQPPLLMRVTPDNKAEVFYKFPTPYPGLPAPVNRIAPMGICRAPSGDLYFADNQYGADKNQKSRMWRLVVKNGKAKKMLLVASGFNVANGLAIHDGYVYITESVLVEGFNPTLRSAVMRFKLDEKNVVLKTPLADDPHIVTTFESRKKDWGFGADGIAFDSKGNLFVGLFGEGEMYKIVLDASGKVQSKEAVRQGAEPDQLRRHVVRPADRQAVRGRFGRQRHPHHQPRRQGEHAGRQRRSDRQADRDARSALRGAGARQHDRRVEHGTGPSPASSTRSGSSRPRYR